MIMNKNDIKVYISEEELEERIDEIASEICRDFDQRDPLVIGVLNGSFMFFSDLMKKVPIDLQIKFINASSYNSGTVSSGNVEVDDRNLDPKLVKDRDIILVEDIVDTGNTIKRLDQHFNNLGAKSVSTVTLLDKPSRRQVEYEPDYVGFTIENKFVLGYGLDYDQRYRNLPYIGIVDEDLIN